MGGGFLTKLGGGGGSSKCITILQFWKENGVKKEYKLSSMQLLSKDEDEDKREPEFHFPTLPTLAHRPLTVYWYSKMRLSSKDIFRQLDCHMLQRQIVEQLITQIVVD